SKRDDKNFIPKVNEREVKENVIEKKEINDMNDSKSKKRIISKSEEDNVNDVASFPETRQKFHEFDFSNNMIFLKSNASKIYVNQYEGNTHLRKRNLDFYRSKEGNFSVSEFTYNSLENSTLSNIKYV